MTVVHGNYPYQMYLGAPGSPDAYAQGMVRVEGGETTDLHVVLTLRPQAP